MEEKNQHHDYQLTPARFRAEIDNISKHILWQQEQLDNHKLYMVVFTIFNLIILGAQILI